MDEARRRETLEIARTLERQGEIDLAVNAYMRAGSVEEGARVLTAARRFGDAGRLILQVLGVAAKDVGKLDPPGRALAHKAAVCFARAGEVATSVELYLALGDPVRAAHVLEGA